MTWFKLTIWTRAIVLAVPFIASQIAISQLQSDFGLATSAAALAAEPDTRETRRTPALRNKVYEKLQKLRQRQKPRI